MQEHRTRLISDVVTGKLDVRRVDTDELPEFEEVPEPGEDREVTDLDSSAPTEAVGEVAF